MASQQPTTKRDAATSPFQHPLVKLVTGMASNNLVRISTIPLANARWILQAQSADPRVRSMKMNPCRDTQEVLKQISNNQGLTAWWRGLLVELFKNGVQFFLSPYLFELQKGIIPRFNPKLHFVKFYLSSIGGGYLFSVLQQLCLRPFEYCRVKLALDSIGKKREYSGAIDVIKKTVKGPNGITAIYSGFSAALLKSFVYGVSYVISYDILLPLNPFSNDRGVVGKLSMFVIAQLVSWISLALSYPFETVERKMQFQADKEKDEWVYSGTIDCIEKTWKEEGIAGFYPGFGNQIITPLATTILTLSLNLLLK